MVTGSDLEELPKKLEFGRHALLGRILNGCGKLDCLNDDLRKGNVGIQN